MIWERVWGLSSVVLTFPTPFVAHTRTGVQNRWVGRASRSVRFSFGWEDSVRGGRDSGDRGAVISAGAQVGTVLTEIKNGQAPATQFKVAGLQGEFMIIVALITAVVSLIVGLLGFFG
ncbi:hypothetical protein MYX82_08075 [Acidobacteria bacterium AH-259-D05]|nr:hypothetical protein [Acidobacteria bacterium AH-259-D05]